MPISTPFVIAHRGASYHLPENTMEAFNLAVHTHRVDMLEYDIRTTKDGVLVIHHDPKLDRTTSGRGYLSQKTYTELQKLDAGYGFDPLNDKTYPKRGQGFKIPRFEEVLLEFPNVIHAVEIKENSKKTTHAVMDLIRQCKITERSIVGSKYDVVSRTLRHRYPEVKRFCSRLDIIKLLVELQRRKKNGSKDPMSVASVPVDFFGIRFDTQEWIDFIHSKDMQVYFWAPDDRQAMQALIQKGADGLVANNPELANQVLGRSGGTAPISA